MEIKPVKNYKKPAYAIKIAAVVAAAAAISGCESAPQNEGIVPNPASTSVVSETAAETASAPNGAQEPAETQGFLGKVSNFIKGFLGEKAETETAPVPEGDVPMTVEPEPDIELAGEIEAPIETEDIIELEGDVPMTVEPEPEIELAGDIAEPVETEDIIELEGDVAAPVETEDIIELAGEIAAPSEDYMLAEYRAAQSSSEVTAAFKDAGLNVNCLYCTEYSNLFEFQFGKNEEYVTDFEIVYSSLTSQQLGVNYEEKNDSSPDYMVFFYDTANPVDQGRFITLANAEECGEAEYFKGRYVSGYKYNLDYCGRNFRCVFIDLTGEESVTKNMADEIAQAILNGGTV